MLAVSRCGPRGCPDGPAGAGTAGRGTLSTIAPYNEPDGGWTFNAGGRLQQGMHLAPA
jgi:hypothetical protein